MKRLKLHRSISDLLNKPREIIRKQRLKKRKQSLFSRIRGFLSFDSFMYGPLTSKKYHAPAADRHTSGGDQEKRSNPNSSIDILKELLSNPDDIVKESAGTIRKAIEKLEESSNAQDGQVVQSTYVTVEKTVTTTTTVVDDENGDLRSSLTDTLHHAPPSGDAELTEPEVDADEEQSWSHEAQEPMDDFQDHIPLDENVAERVANQLIGGLGGRFSDDLGINVNISDDKVECWFLAANLFSRSVPFEVSKKTYKALSEAGISKLSDISDINESKLGAILESTGYTKKGQRVATHLKKLANHLDDNNWGRISTFKHMSDSSDLIRQLRLLPSVTLISVRIFLRELRGLWRAVPYEFDMRTKKAAMHLKLLGSIKPSSHPEVVLTEFAQFTGIDLRDLETALFKLGTNHEQHYRECPGGSDCKILKSAEELMILLPSDVLL